MKRNVLGILLAGAIGAALITVPLPRSRHRNQPRRMAMPANQPRTPQT